MVLDDEAQKIIGNNIIIFAIQAEYKIFKLKKQ